eukprot:m.26642 g.26642  ORF g.26642 m.26642 type:complete len:485 (+) comp29429_c0_seq1:138-1592(+)
MTSRFVDFGIRRRFLRSSSHFVHIVSSVLLSPCTARPSAMVRVDFWNAAAIVWLMASAQFLCRASGTDLPACSTLVENRYHWIVPETAKVGQVISVLRPYVGQMTDDLENLGGSAVKRMYTINAGNEQGHFIFDDNGALKLNRSFGTNSSKHHLLRTSLRCVFGLGRFQSNITIQQTACIDIQTCSPSSWCKAVISNKTRETAVQNARTKSPPTSGPSESLIAASRHQLSTASPSTLSTNKIDSASTVALQKLPVEKKSTDDDDDDDDDFAAEVMWPLVAMLALFLSLVINAALASVICCLYRKTRQSRKDVNSFPMASPDVFTNACPVAYYNTRGRRVSQFHENVSGRHWYIFPEEEQAHASNVSTREMTPLHQAQTMENGYNEVTLESYCGNNPRKKSEDKLDTTAEWVTEQRSITERKMSLNNALEETLEQEGGDAESSKTAEIQGRPVRFSISSSFNPQVHRICAWTENGMDPTELTQKQ